MSNMCAFHSCFERAVRANDCAGSLVESPTIRVPTTVIMFAHEHIHLLEEQLGAAQNRIRELEASVKYTEATKE